MHLTAMRAAGDAEHVRRPREESLHSRLGDTAMSNMYVVIQDQNGGVGYQPIGQALVEADLDASLTNLAFRRKREPLATLTVYSSKQAAEAIQELKKLGDVDVDGP